jgi:hypothetical protein
MRSMLELRSLLNGTGWADAWSFSAADDRLLRDCLGSLEDCATTPPCEGRDPAGRRHVIAVLIDKGARAAGSVARPMPLEYGR